MSARLQVRFAIPAALVALAALGDGCVETDRTQDLPALDPDRYEVEVQPFVARSCATLDCHGDRGRPLRLYSELGLRLDGSLRTRPIDDDNDPQPLTEAELVANVATFSALLPAPGGAGELLALSKPLSRRAGGAHHVGGSLFSDTDHPGHVCLRRWLLGRDEPDEADSCFEALQRLE